jgi:hypothetical protein
MTEVSLSERTFARVESRVGDSDFSSPDEYVDYVVSTVLDQLEGVDQETAGDREEVMDKLRDLGYLE